MFPTLSVDTPFGSHLNSPCQECIVRMLCDNIHTCDRFMKFVAILVRETIRAELETKPVIGYEKVII